MTERKYTNRHTSMPSKRKSSSSMARWERACKTSISLPSISAANNITVATIILLSRIPKPWKKSIARSSRSAWT